MPPHKLIYMNLPKIKATISSFLLGEEGKISKSSVLAMGSMFAIGTLSTAVANAAHSSVSDLSFQTPNTEVATHTSAYVSGFGCVSVCAIGAGGCAGCGTLTACVNGNGDCAGGSACSGTGDCACGCSGDSGATCACGCAL